MIRTERKEMILREGKKRMHQKVKSVNLAGRRDITVRKKTETKNAAETAETEKRTIKIDTVRRTETGTEEEKEVKKEMVKRKVETG